MRYNSPWTIVVAVLATAGYYNRHVALRDTESIFREQPGRKLADVPDVEAMLPNIVSLMRVRPEEAAEEGVSRC